MRNIDSREEIAKIDTQNVLGSIEALPDQCLDAWHDANQVNLPENYKHYSKAVLCGMGGSGLGGRVIESVYGGNMKVPLVRVNDYHLPNFTDEDTLIVCSSYSGKTEETINNMNEAIEKKAKWMAIGTGGQLIETAKKENVPFYQINPKYNPSNQPRMAIGYSIIGQLSLVAKAGLINLTEFEINSLAESMKVIIQRNAIEATDNNLAKDLALKMQNKIILLIASSHLLGALHTFNNQLNENAKTLSFDFQIPELNHHLMEGLKFPKENNKNIFLFIVNSNLYSDQIKKRIKITKDISEKNGIETFEFSLKADNALSQSFELIQFGAFVNFYLAMLYGIDPAPIPWVDYFKAEMAK